MSCTPAPFELSYTLSLPEDEPQRSRAHLDASRAADRLIREKLQPDDQMAARDEFLDDLLRLDQEAQVVMQALAVGRDIPPDSLPSDFEKVVRILEDAVRGLTIRGPRDHANFWAGKEPNILARVEDGSMLCDGSWPPDRIAIFLRWIDEGRRP